MEVVYRGLLRWFGNERHCLLVAGSAPKFKAFNARGRTVSAVLTNWRTMWTCPAWRASAILAGSASMLVMCSFRFVATKIRLAR